MASGVFTKDINKALYVSEKLQAGTVFVNTYNKTDVAAPFGGFKQSGFGKDLGENKFGSIMYTSNGQKMETASSADIGPPRPLVYNYSSEIGKTHAPF